MEEALEPTRKTRYGRGETVFVPASAFPEPDSTDFALVPRTVLAAEGRSVRVDIPGSDGGDTMLVATSKVHSSNLGILVLSVGDIASEHGLIEPLHKSMVQFLRLMLPDNMVTSWRVRTTLELIQFWTSDQDPWRSISHVVLISHAGKDGLQFLDQKKPFGGKQLGSLLDVDEKVSPKVFLSLACESGKASFAKSFSQARICRDLIAPFQKVHGASASQYAQSLLAHHLLDGVTVPIAKRRADQTRTTGVHFRRWHDGQSL